MFEYESDTRTRSVSPDSLYNTPANGKNRRGTNIVKINNILNSEHGSPLETTKNKGGRPKNAKRTYDGELKPLAQRIVLTKGGRPLATPENMQSLDRMSPVLGPSSGPRPRMTSHQLAVQQNRKERINHLIERKLQRLDRKKRRLRLKQGAIARAWNRIKDIEDPLVLSDNEERPRKHAADEVYDEEGNVVQQEEEEHPIKRVKLDKGRGGPANVSRPPAGLIPRKEEQMGDEHDDFGEEAMALAAAIRRTKRRLERWQLDENRRIAAGLTGGGQQPLLEEDAEGEDDIAVGGAAGQVEYVSDEDEDEDVN
jgi:Ino eighty subunit 1